ncbi:hypothetical protein CJ203_10260 [Corynebacterium tuscaniense]|uniref:Uncharacterized protein n=1 Tax=Corynebacterium tuscaniense TaxID=302449 RepID=A0A2N6T2N0_9CORY|nr:hypothetical protein CJ203_10260 [Corynebacterium tuscaniense]
MRRNRPGSRRTVRRSTSHHWQRPSALGSPQQRRRCRTQSHQGHRARITPRKALTPIARQTG